MTHDFHAMPIDTSWRLKWVYSWYKFVITLPKSTSGERVVLSINPASKPPESRECLVWKMELLLAHIDWHPITLTIICVP